MRPGQLPVPPVTLDEDLHPKCEFMSIRGRELLRPGPALDLCEEEHRSSVEWGTEDILGREVNLIQLPPQSSTSSCASLPIEERCRQLLFEDGAKNVRIRRRSSASAVPRISLSRPQPPNRVKERSRWKWRCLRKVLHVEQECYTMPGLSPCLGDPPFLQYKNLDNSRSKSRLERRLVQCRVNRVLECHCAARE